MSNLFDKHDRDQHQKDLELKRGVTLWQARQTLGENLDSGMNCPCCGQWAKRYKRPFNSGMAMALIWLVKNWLRYANDDGWIELAKVAPRHVVKNREYDKWRLWRVARTAFNEDTGKRCSGLWQPTGLGRDFVYKRASVPAWCKIYDGEVRVWADESISIEEALGTKFNYDELMRDWS